jgi:hypothetical protein
MSAAKALMYLVPQHSELINYLNIENWPNLIQKINMYDYSHFKGSKYELLCLIMSIIDTLRNNGTDLALILEGLKITQNEYFDYSNFCKNDIKALDFIKDSN